jgi:hypothetical protein
MARLARSRLTIYRYALRSPSQPISTPPGVTGAVARQCPRSAGQHWAMTLTPQRIKAVLDVGWREELGVDDEAETRTHSPVSEAQAVGGQALPPVAAEDVDAPIDEEVAEHLDAVVAASPFDASSAPRRSPTIHLWPALSWPRTSSNIEPSPVESLGSQFLSVQGSRSPGFTVRTRGIVSWTRLSAQESPRRAR